MSITECAFRRKINVGLRASDLVSVFSGANCFVINALSNSKAPRRRHGSTIKDDQNFLMRSFFGSFVTGDAGGDRERNRSILLAPIVRAVERSGRGFGGELGAALLHSAVSLLGDAGAFEAVPWFWSDQYDWQLQIAGLPSEGSMTIRRDLGDGTSMDFALAASGRLVGMSALGEIEKIGRDARIADKLIAARAAPDITRLRDPRTKLKALLPA